MSPLDEMGATLWNSFGCLIFGVMATGLLFRWLKKRKYTENLINAIICGIVAVFFGLGGASGLFLGN